jgi:phosphohistidine phosphatase
MEEVVEDLTGRWVAMPTAAIAVLDLPGGWGSESAQLRYAGRPADL